MTGITLHPSWLVLAAAMLSGPPSEPTVLWQFVMNGPNAERQVSPHYGPSRNVTRSKRLNRGWRSNSQTATRWSEAARLMLSLAPEEFSSAPSSLPDLSTELFQGRQIWLPGSGFPGVAFMH